MHGMHQTEASKNGAHHDPPEINHLNILHPSERPNELLRALDPRVDNRKLPQSCEALEGAWVFQVVVVEIQYAHVGDHARKVGRK